VAILLDATLQSTLVAARIAFVTHSAALLQCAEAAMVAGGRLNAVGMTMPDSALPRRIRQILAPRRQPPLSTTRLVCAALLTVGAATTVTIASPAVIPASSPLAKPLLQAPTPAVAGGTPAFDVVSMKRNTEPGNNYPLSPPVGGRLALRKQLMCSSSTTSHRHRRTDPRGVESLLLNPRLSRERVRDSRCQQ
jgi:hypothetical protein